MEENLLPLECCELEPWDKMVIFVVARITGAYEQASYRIGLRPSTVKIIREFHDEQALAALTELELDGGGLLWVEESFDEVLKRLNGD